MPPSFLVDEHGQLVDTFGGVESLLKIKSRRPTQNLLDMLGDDLRTVVSGALHRVRRDLESVALSRGDDARRQPPRSRSSPSRCGTRRAR